MSPTPIRVLLVDDSPVALTILKRMLATSPDIEVVGTARHGKEALELIPQLKPTVICTDFLMPVMDGLEFTQQVMEKYSCPILVISSTVEANNTDRVFPLLQAGAVDVFPKPGGARDGDDQSARQLVRKITDRGHGARCQQASTWSCREYCRLKRHRCQRHRC